MNYIFVYKTHLGERRPSDCRYQTMFATSGGVGIYSRIKKKNKNVDRSEKTHNLCLLARII